MLIVKLSLYCPLLAWMVKLVALKVTLVTPYILPVALLNESPDGSRGDISQLRTSPPSTIGLLPRAVTLVVSSSSVYG